MSDPTMPAALADGWGVCPQCGGRYTSYPYPFRAMCNLCVKGKVPTELAGILSEGRWGYRLGDDWHYWYDGLVGISKHRQDGELIITCDGGVSDLSSIIERFRSIQAALAQEGTNGNNDAA